MAVTGAGSTAEVLGMINALQADKSTADERFQDKAFAGAMTQWQNAFEADKQRNAMHLDYVLRNMSKLDEQVAAEEKGLADLGVVANSVATPDAQKVVSDLLTAKQSRIGSIREQQAQFTQTLARLRGVRTGIENRLKGLRETATQYGAGKADSAVIDLVRSKLPAPNMANINPADLAVDKYEAASTIKGLMKSGRPEDVQSAAPYVDAKGEIDFNSPRFMGLMASIAESNKDYAKTMVDLGDIAVRRSAVEAQKAETQARLKNPQLQEYERVRGSIEARSAKEGITYEEAQKKIFSESPETELRFNGIFGVEKSMEDEPTKIQKIEAMVAAKLGAAGVTKEKNPKAYGKAVIMALEEAGYKNMRDIIPAKAADKPNFAAKWWDNFKSQELFGKTSEAQDLGFLITDIKSGGAKAEEASKALTTKYPGFDKVFQQKQDEQWAKDRSVDMGKALDEAYAEISKRIPAPSKARGSKGGGGGF